MQHPMIFTASNSPRTESFCSFDSFLNKHNLDEPELRYLALIVRGADTDRHDLTPESGGLFAISLGLSDMHPGDDQAVLRDGFIVYDALYRNFCRREKHLRFPPPQSWQLLVKEHWFYLKMRISEVIRLPVALRMLLALCAGDSILFWMP